MSEHRIIVGRRIMGARLVACDCGDVIGFRYGRRAQNRAATKHLARRERALSALAIHLRPLTLVPSTLRRCIVHDTSFERVCNGCEADRKAASA